MKQLIKSERDTMIKLYNGYKIPKLGLGTFLIEDGNVIEDVIKRALEIGYRHFDTAQMYHNEKLIGTALANSKIKREELFITTKLANHHNKEETKRLIMQSLKDLQTDYIDLLLIHWPNHDDQINLNTWSVFEELYEEGLLKAIGVSNFTRYQLDNLMRNCKIKPMINQVEMHPALSQIPLKEYLNKHEIAITSYGPLMRGKMNESPYFEVLSSIANNKNISVVQVLIAWGLSKDVMMIPKTVNLDRLLENYQSLNVELSKEEILLIDSLNTGRRLYADPSNNVYGKFVK